MINDDFSRSILDSTGATGLYVIEVIQELWSGYGEIIRYGLNGSRYKSVVVKYINLKASKGHPRGWTTSLSHERKVKSYDIEMEFYKKWSANLPKESPVPGLLAIKRLGEESLIVLEDLNSSGYAKRVTNITIDGMKRCLKWLAYFHIHFLNTKPEGLWDVGCYWHLDTRPEELQVLKEGELKKYARYIENILVESRYQTIVHGDAKLANFCFSENGEAAMVDFQYVGGGPGIKDVAYFIGSCLYEDDCETYEEELLSSYFDSLEMAVKDLQVDVDVQDLVSCWRRLYKVAWCDFHRFLKGWSPGHWKINSYSERLTREVIKGIKDGEYA